MRLPRIALAAASSALTLAGCDATPLSTFHPAGRDAVDIGQLFWWMSLAARRRP